MTGKMEKKRFGMIYGVILLLLATISTSQAFAADPGHTAQAISTGQFESRGRAYHPIGYRQSDDR